MEYFFYCRDKPDIGDVRWKLAEAHWSFMDHYADSMIARGPTLATDNDEEVTGSVHLVDLPNFAAADVFAFEEPYFKAGIFDKVLVRRWSNILERTMWDFAGGGGRRFLVIGHGAVGATARRSELREQQIDYLVAGGFDKGLIACGPLLSHDGAEWLGTAMLVELANRTVVEAMMTGGPYVRAGLYEEVEIHNWRFGGRTIRLGGALDTYPLNSTNDQR
jgi:uncharacterized protein YciI